MKVVKTDYKLVLREPGKDEKILWKGTERECEKKKLNLSFTHNKEWLVVEEDEPDIKEVRPTLKGILGFLAICSLTYLCWINGKKVCVID